MFSLYQVFLLRNRETLNLKLFFRALLAVKKTEAVQPYFFSLYFVLTHGKDDQFFKILRGMSFTKEIKVVTIASHAKSDVHLLILLLKSQKISGLLLNQCLKTSSVFCANFIF